MAPAARLPRPQRRRAPRRRVLVAARQREPGAPALVQREPAAPLRREAIARAAPASPVLRARAAQDRLATIRIMIIIMMLLLLQPPPWCRRCNPTKCMRTCTCTCNARSRQPAGAIHCPGHLVLMSRCRTVRRHAGADTVANSAQHAGAGPLPLAAEQSRTAHLRTRLRRQHADE